MVEGLPRVVFTERDCVCLGGGGGSATPYVDRRNDACL